MAAEIVHHDDIARAQYWNQNLVDVCLESDTIDRPVEHHRRDHASKAKPGDEGGCFPVAVGNADAKPFASRRTSIATGHVCRGPRFVDEDEAFRIEIELAVKPLLAPLQDVRAILLACVCGLFST